MRARWRRWTPEALYARMGADYVEVYYRLLYVSVICFAVPAIFGGLVLVTDASLDAYSVIFVLAVLSAILALRLSVRWGDADLAPARRWRAGDSETATIAAWRAAVEVVPAGLPRAFASCVFGSAVPATLAIYFLVDFSLSQTLVCFGGIIAFALYPVVLHAFLIESFLAPLRRDIARHLPRDYEVRRPFPSLNLWLLGSLPVVTIVNGLVVALLANTVDSLAANLLLSFVVTLLWTLAALFLIVRMVLRPVQELTSVATRIRAGDLSARAAPEREDELGMLLLEFNRMSDDLAAARERLVSAREEERRRLRRDLHDGLGAAIAGVNVQLQAAAHALDRDPSRVAPLLAGANEAISDVLGGVRRLVYDLRPPVLDALGLEGAISDHAGTLRGPGAPEFSVRARDLGDLPAAVEVAALRIAQEAMTNVVRHARARHCVVELSCNQVGSRENGRVSDLGALELRVRDDGIGFAGHHAGVGLVSMRERAGELGGSVAIGALPGGGTEIVAVLPAA